MTTQLKFIEKSGEALFVLRCTVKEMNASNIPTISPNETTAVLLVDEVFRAPDILGNLKGKFITAKLTTASAKAGQQIIITARPWQYSENIGVVEIERTIPNVNNKDFQLQIIKANLNFLDKELENRISAADIIISGKVSDVEKIKSKEIYTLQDNKEDWYEAKVLVSTLEKGTLGKIPEVNVRFPGNDSEKRYASPKFIKGQEGIWLLHKSSEKNRKKGETAEIYLLAPDPLDFHLLNQLSRIRSLIKRNK